MAHVTVLRKFMSDLLPLKVYNINEHHGHNDGARHYIFGVF